MLEPGRRDRSYWHRGGDEPLLGVTIDEHLQRVVEREGDRDAVVSIPQETRLTYRALDAEVQSLGRALMSLGVGRGDRVGVWSTDNIEWVLLQLATARIGAILVSINPAYRPAELEHALLLARVQVLFMIPRFRHSDYVGMLATIAGDALDAAPEEFACPTLPELKRLVIWDPAHRRDRDTPAPAFLSWEELLSRGKAVPDVELVTRSASLDPDDPINIQFTSGTTGAPKAVLLTHHNILNNGYFIGRAMRFTPADRLCVPVPFYHCFGMVVSNLACLTHGATIVIPAAHFEAGATLAAIEEERCTAVHGVPTMFVAELEQLARRSYDLSSLRTGIMAGAPCAPELIRRVMEELGCPEILIGYGQTEASPVTHCTRFDDLLSDRVDTVGLNLPHQEVKVIEPTTGRVVAPGEAGEVCFRGYHVMAGYYGQPEKTRECLDDRGWLRSGDLGVMDSRGYLKITGRLKDLIIRGGENISPAEIEAFYFGHPKIAEIAVVGVPDERMGEEVAAWVVLHEGEEATPEELREYGRGQIAHFKIPRTFRIVEGFPLTVTGKIQKFRIRELEAEERRDGGG